MNNGQNEIMIASFTPAFAERDVFWFEENKEKIKNLARATSFWTDNILILSRGQKTSMSETVKKLHTMQYEASHTVSLHGQYAARGGMLAVFPVNADVPVRIEFFGNTIESITPLAARNISEKEREKLLQKEMRKKKISRLQHLKAGDYVVHLDHGIGIYKGIIAKQDGTRYFQIAYAPPKHRQEHDTLFVPERLAHKLSVYLGFHTPTIHRLSGNAWEHTKKKVSEDAQALAKELLDIYSKRRLAKRAPYQRNTEEQKEFDAQFPHIETHDQSQAIRDVFGDMEKEEPMDRLICGDVGFGKTEVALRAAFIAITSGKQVTILAPTTVLADQHFETCKERFAKFPVTIGMLSRFELPAAQKETVCKLSEGALDIVVGTHRLLSGDVRFKNLGLLIIDEEQRFGVKQKEKLKKLRANIDILSLSATPIPRTLYLSLSGLRAISIINTPPFGRKPIETFVLPYKKDTAKTAIEKEMQRNGQVYFLHNKIETIEKTKQMLKTLVPRARIEAMHGRTSEQNLRNIMRRFKEKKYDVLVSTTIIENGLDIKNANTLIVDDATRLGLAQAYQIRGRIGRAEETGHAYFLYPEKTLSENARKRLDALQSAVELGSGYFIAQKDLEIRGAGNILGKKQSGAINRVGLNLYCQILNEAVEQLNHENTRT